MPRKPSAVTSESEGVSDMDEFVEQIPYPETKNYVKKVLRSYWVYGNVY